MTRRYPAKGRKRNHEERLDEEVDEDKQEQKQCKVEADEQRKTGAGNSGNESEEAEDKVLTLKKCSNISGIIFVLEKAPLEVASVGKSYQILDSDDHRNFLLKMGRNPDDYRPDIVHEALLSILDSPLNKAGKIRAVYVKTQKGVLFEVKPHVRIPRTYKRFLGLMLQLLRNSSTAPNDNGEKLLRVIKNPVTQCFPANSRRIGFSYSSEKLVEMEDYVASISENTPLVFVVGTMAYGKIPTEYVDDLIAISNYPLSTACCLCTICDGVQEHFSSTNK